MEDAVHRFKVSQVQANEFVDNRPLRQKRNQGQRGGIGKWRIEWLYLPNPTLDPLEIRSNP